MKDADYFAQKVFEKALQKPNPYWYIRFPEDFEHIVQRDLYNTWSQVEREVINRWNTADMARTLFKFKALQIERMLADLGGDDWSESVRVASNLLDSLRTDDVFLRQCSNLTERLRKAIQGRLRWAFCSFEDASCICNQSYVSPTNFAIQVRYGSSEHNKWTELSIESYSTPRFGSRCSNETFGDPIPHVRKECHCGVIDTRYMSQQMLGHENVENEIHENEASRNSDDLHI
jgi:hypothetical protein